MALCWMLLISVIWASLSLSMRSWHSRYARFREVPHSNFKRSLCLVPHAFPTMIAAPPVTFAIHPFSRAYCGFDVFTLIRLHVLHCMASLLKRRNWPSTNVLVTIQL
ncbi:hypothetical protein BDR05DRAFT_959561 [Suillus weaverae]|nr:hypothetical protein BDR05DRAFT_959561 [Suillus weaverae]